jgi:hypothetical protein
MSNFSQRDIEYLLTPVAIRETTKRIMDKAISGETHFKVNLDKLDACSDYVMDVIKENYPTLDIPFHSRWGHFKVGDIDREKELNSKIESRDPMEIARVKLDLVITSVLLDAGAGKEWTFLEDGTRFNRSEGLAVASYHMFLNGDFSKDGSLVADGEGLKNFSSDKLRQGFQVSENNPLVGVDGRVSLIQKLGEAVLANKEVFPKGRPGSIIDYLCEKHGKNFEVKDVLDAILKGLGPIWPGRIDANGVNLGDVWHYPSFGTEVNATTVVCYHKLSQWLTYSLVVPMIQSGLIIKGAEKLTGLAEYRNGGLFVDYGVIELRDEKNFKIKHKPSSELIIEWRALTVQLLDKIGELVQQKLNKTPDECPLAKVLEGGTWWAGRKIAKEKRADGSTPITLDSDGTVF